MSDNNTISYMGIGNENSEEMIGLKVIQILSIPSFSILEDGHVSEKEAEKTAERQRKKEMGNLLSEIYQCYKNRYVRNQDCKDISLEFLWLTEPVANQPYNAKIALYIVIRTIGVNKQNVDDVVNEIHKICESTITLEKYEYTSIPYSELQTKLNTVDTDSVKAIVKEERFESLQNQFFYGYDKIPENSNDLSRIVNVMIDYPACAVSFQLIPTIFSDMEATSISQTSQTLDTLCKGVMTQGLGNVSFSAAENYAETYRYYENSRNAPLFNFNIVVFGSYSAATSISNQIVGQLSRGEDKTANIKIIDVADYESYLSESYFSFPWAIQETIEYTERIQFVQSNISYLRLPYIITADEAVEFTRLPIGNSNIAAGFAVNESAKTSRTYTDNIVNSGDISVGKLKSSAKGDTIGFALKDLAKHMLVVGTPGSGKTTFSVSLLDRLWKIHKIPFLVIEPAKNEYRALVQSIPDLQVFTPGKNTISPFVYNPFVPPKKVRLETYKSTLKTAFAAAVSMTTPLDKIFEESINNCYSDFRWLDTYTVDDKGKIFNIADFIKCFQETFDAIGYTGDAKNIGRAGVVRLNSLANLFDNYYSIPIEDIFTKPTVIELAAIENSDQKALIISLLLLSILAYVNANYVGEGGLKNVILLEEAHVLLDAESNSGQGEANPSAIAQGLVKRMLAEIRSYGVGLIIADQSPRKVTTDVVALTDMKMAFRLVEATDKQILADSTNMTDVQVQRLSKLKPGEAFFFFNKLDEPEEVKTEDYRLQNNISISLSDEGIRKLSVYWNDKKDKLRPYPECSCVKYCTEQCEYSRRILARELARRIFTRNFRPDSKDFETVRQVIPRLRSLIESELNDEVLDAELIACTKVHLFRKIKYGTKIDIHDATIQANLEKA